MNRVLLTVGSDIHPPTIDPAIADGDLLQECRSVIPAGIVFTNDKRVIEAFKGLHQEKAANVRIFHWKDKLTLELDETGQKARKLKPCGKAKPCGRSRPGLGDRTEAALKAIGVTEERYKEVKKLFGLPPDCNCQARKDFLNRVSEWWGRQS